MIDIFKKERMYREKGKNVTKAIENVTDQIP